MPRLYDEMDFQRATQCYLWAMPIVSFAKWQEQHETVFGQEDGDLVQLESFRDRMGFLTHNDTTTYLVGYVNLERTGPLVIDYPKGPTAGGILDMWQRPITDMGLAGPDRGEGGKYDTETRSFIDTKHDIAGLDSRKDLIKNEDGSVDLYIGPEAPKGKEKNWIPTAPAAAGSDSSASTRQPKPTSIAAGNCRTSFA
ncbi:MAG: DUF1214 domain-containing protein [Pirellulaceae bacterium]